MKKFLLIFLIAAFVLVFLGVYSYFGKIEYLSKTEDIGKEIEKSDLIRVSFPRPKTKVESPLIIKGEARGYWFFEASFPVKLLDSSGAILAQGIATAKDEWMTENFVPFEAVLSFKKPTTAKGILILMKDNPSGLAEHDDSIEIPVVFVELFPLD